MVAIGAVLVVVSLSVLATRVGSLALEATGLASDAARFQAQSLFTGVGFATSEAESITEDPAQRVGVLVVGLLVLLLLVRSSRFARWLRRRLERLLARWTAADIRDYRRLLGITDEYAVQEAVVTSEDWLAGRALREPDLPGEGIQVLGVRRSDGTYLGAPGSGTTLETGDVVVLYGHQDQLRDIESRPAGDEGEQRRSRSEREHARRQAGEEGRS